jgi:hypothetical protein
MRMTEANSAYLMFNRNSADKISSAAQNAKVIIDTDKWTSFYRNVIDALAKRPDLTVKIRFTDEKHARRCITIPAGTDLDGFIDSKGFTGFEYLVSKGFETPYQWGCKPYINLSGRPGPLQRAGSHTGLLSENTLNFILWHIDFLCDIGVTETIT